ncbi:hematopoietic cell signal transducer [Stigmatopora argus]
MAYLMLLCFVFSLCKLTVAHTTTNSTISCYRIEPGYLAGIVGADVLVTGILVTIAYRYASKKQQKNHKHREKSNHNMYMNVRRSRKT